ncbi:MAG: hypothetical protein EOP84_11930 [Verrucomicrobiaceae bacterium]|nr:MAG: hypothetical protein EOP84_11930 [Verrucomicrobiaceae bacterium]
MSRDRDPQQRLWLALGHGGKGAGADRWRYWKKPDAERTWVIAAPNNRAEFLLVHHAVSYQGRELFVGRTQWDATWKTLAYFYSDVVPKLEPPPLDP